jgi:hypothetical protein
MKPKAESRDQDFRFLGPRIQDFILNLSFHLIDVQINKIFSIKITFSKFYNKIIST